MVRGFGVSSDSSGPAQAQSCGFSPCDPGAPRRGKLALIENSITAPPEGGTPNVGRSEPNAVRGNPRNSCLDNFTHHVLTSVGVRHMNGALRVVSPLAINDETISMVARAELDGGSPDSVRAFAHRDRIALPMREVADQQNAHGI